MNHPRSGFAAPPQGGTASGRAKPDPRRSLGWTCGFMRREPGFGTVEN